jgi:hypothetical protein
VLGETWVAHWGKHKVEATRGVLEPAATTDALFNSVTDLFGTTDVYEAAPPADAKILARGLVLQGMRPTDAPATYRKTTAAKIEQAVNAPAMPIVWTRNYLTSSGASAKIFTTTLGAATDFEQESLRRLIVNATYWAAELAVPAKADVTPFDNYTPRPYGFAGYRTGLTPADHALGKILPAGGTVPSAPPPGTPNAINTPITLNLGARIAFIGNGLADRMQHAGALETLIHAKYPKHELVFRNLAVTGDEIVARARSKDFGTPDEWLSRTGTDVIFAFFWLQ